MDYEDGFYEHDNVSLTKGGVRAGSGGGWTTFKVYTPYIIVGKNGPDPGAAPPREGAVITWRGSGSIGVLLSRDFGATWEVVGRGSSGNVDVTPKVYGRWGYLVKFDLGSGAVLEDMSLLTAVQVNPMSLPRVRGVTRDAFSYRGPYGRKNSGPSTLGGFQHHNRQLGSTRLVGG